MIKEPLLDQEFLKKLYNQKNREVYARLIALDFDENPLEEISGKISSNGSLGLDGKSAVRRTCSFNIQVSLDQTITDYYWTFSSKFKLEIGLSNDIDSNYSSIIWFKEGLFVITSFNMSKSINSYNISITAKDKMCLLNGEVGGHFTAPIELSKIKTYDNNGDIIEEQVLLLKEIIFNLVHIFGRESLSNIIINDLDDYAVELLQYIGNSDLFYLRNMYTLEVEDIIIDSNYQVIDKKTNSKIAIGNKDQIIYYSLSNFINNNNATTVSKTDKPEEYKYQIIRIENGQTAGYRETPLIYPGEKFEVGSGGTITQALDTIIKHFSDFEYFYDVEGRFHFQKKKTYLNTAWSPLNYNSLKVNILSNSNEYIWRFDDNELTSNFSNTPNLLNLKNDYIVWGFRTGVSGAKLPIHMRYAIDKKPTSYISTTGEIFTIDQYDWRELIFQMATDYFNNNQKGIAFYQALTKNNPWVKNNLTGYEHYYTDMLGYWREIYNPELWPQHNGWNNELLETPEIMPFWLDFIEGSDVFYQFNIKEIGDRTKVVNDTAATAISFRDTIDVLYVKNLSDVNIRKEGYTYIQLPDEYFELFVMSATQKSLKNELDTLLYNYSYCSENYSITSIPIYHLEPNTKILIADNHNNIQGQYIVNSITIPLSHSGNMSISAIKDIERIY